MFNNKNLTNEEIWKIIREKYNNKNDYTKDFIYRSIKKYGDIFTYDRSYRKKWTDKVIVTCPIHGNFKVIPNTFLNKYGIGCPSCSREEKKRLQFLKEADKFEKKLKKKYPQFSIINKNEYNGYNNKLLFKCNIDECIFSATPNSILNGNTVCPACKKEKERQKQELVFVNNFYSHFTDGILLENENGYFWENAICNILVKSKYTGEVAEFTIKSIYQRFKRGTTELFKSSRLIKSKMKFIEDAFKKYGNNFKYDNVVYINDMTPVTIICNNCGKEFTITPRTFLSNNYRHVCICQIIHKKFSDLENLLKFTNISIVTTEKDLLQNGNLNGDTVLTFKCNSCGNIFKSSIKYIKNKLRKYADICSKCGSRNLSRGEKIIESWLIENNIEFKNQVRIVNCIEGRNTNLVIIDFVVINNNYKYFIEYNGKQHYTSGKIFNITEEDFKKQLKRDNNVRDYCEKNNILFIEIPYTYKTKKSIFFVLSEIFLNGKNPENIIKLPKINM